MTLRVARENKILIFCLAIFTLFFLLNFSVRADENVELEEKLRFLETQKIIIFKINRLEKKLREFQKEIDSLKIQSGVRGHNGEEMDHGALPQRGKKGIDGYKKPH